MQKFDERFGRLNVPFIITTLSPGRYTTEVSDLMKACGDGRVYPVDFSPLDLERSRKFLQESLIFNVAVEETKPSQKESSVPKDNAYGKQRKGKICFVTVPNPICTRLQSRKQQEKGEHSRKGCVAQLFVSVYYINAHWPSVCEISIISLLPGYHKLLATYQSTLVLQPTNKRYNI